MKIKTNYYNLTAYTNVLLIECFKSWDERVVNDGINDIMTIALKLYKDKPWAILADARKWELHTPGAEDMLFQWFNLDRKTPITHLIVVLGKSELKKWQVNKTVKDATKFETTFFETISEAEDYLASLGYHRTPLENQLD